MKIAITGASGFIGRHVVAALATRPGVELTASSRNASHAANLPAGVRHVALDLTESTAIAYARLGAPDVVVHLAWEGLPNYRARRHFEVELPAQYAFLRALVDAGLPSLVVTGTCYEYGMASGPLAESFTGEPTNPYGFAKLTLLRQLEFLQHDRRFTLTWARLFYLWGEGQAPTSLYSLLATAVARGDTVFPMSGGEQLRDYLPVAVLAEHLATLACRAANDGVVNVCSGEPVAIRALVERWLVANRWSIDLDLGRLPYPDYEPLAFWGDAGRLKAIGPVPDVVNSTMLACISK